MGCASSQPQTHTKKPPLPNTGSNVKSNYNTAKINNPQQRLEQTKQLNIINQPVYNLNNPKPAQISSVNKSQVQKFSINEQSKQIQSKKQSEVLNTKPLNESSLKSSQNKYLQQTKKKEEIEKNVSNISQIKRSKPFGEDDINQNEKNKENPEARIRNNSQNKNNQKSVIKISESGIKKQTGLSEIIQNKIQSESKNTIQNIQKPYQADSIKKPSRLSGVVQTNEIIDIPPIKDFDQYGNNALLVSNRSKKYDSPEKNQTVEKNVSNTKLSLPVLKEQKGLQSQDIQINVKSEYDKDISGINQQDFRVLGEDFFDLGCDFNAQSLIIDMNKVVW